MFYCMNKKKPVCSRSIYLAKNERHERLFRSVPISKSKQRRGLRRETTRLRPCPLSCSYRCDLTEGTEPLVQVQNITSLWQNGAQFRLQQRSDVLAELSGK